MYAVLKYIHDNIHLPLSAGETAKQFGYSQWYFCDLFKKTTGKTFVEYVRHYRIQLAALEILSGEKVIQVAAACGYDSVGGFNKAFFKEYGCSPTEYCKQIKESQLYYEKRRISMFQLSDRCAALREEAVNQKSYMRHYFAQRIVYYYLGQMEVALQGGSSTARVAAGIANTLQKFTPLIIPGELIVGFNFGEGQYDEYFMITDTPEGRQIMRDNSIPEPDAARFFSLLQGPQYLEPLPPYPDFTQVEEDSFREWSAIGRCTDSNHTVIGYEQVLQKGFLGLLQDVEAAERQNGTNPMYDAIKQICSAAMEIGEKYAREAEKLLKNENEEYRQEDLQQIIRTCSRVPKYPAGSFLEAVQSLWFAHIINTWEDGINANSLGRLDQILYPYYQADIEKGILTKEEAFEILCCLWIKLYRDYDVQQSCVGGCKADGSSAVNDLSYLMLDVTEQLNFIRCLSVRYSAKTEKTFLRRALEVVGHMRKGVPFFFNDDIMIPALLDKGIRDAWDYTQIGCVETVIPGKSNPHAVAGETNFLKAIEYVLCNGNSMLYPDFANGVPTGPLSSLNTYAKFYDAVLKQIRHILDVSCSVIAKYRPASVTNAPRPYKSLLTQGCIESGRDFNDGGAVYDYYQVMFGGIPNLADSLAVIRKFVYEEKKYTLEELKYILENNFPDESVRAEFMNKAPKYGNDIDEVDTIAADLVNRACDMLDALSLKYGLSFHAQPFTFLWMIEHGQHSAASPDGRRKGEPIAYSCSAMQGRDFNGLTALFNSIAKLPARRTPGTTSAIVEADPKLFCNRNIDALTDILIAASERGLCNVQFNVVDVNTLMDAKKHPDHYNNLAVRVSGFSQKFNLLTPELQDHIIGRMKHACF